jgi:nitroimidazol reductase NimA-like FMN-containing flavoprotein (pyridoxamine 5'-phosphate oxidase superfamily)
MATEGMAGLQGARMTREDIDDFLYERGHGVLSLAHEGEAYGIPVSFGYDGQSLFFIFQRPSEASRKELFAETTTRASFLAYEALETDDWTSVIVTGPLQGVDDERWQTLLEAIEDNAWFPSLFSQVDPRRDFLGFELSVEEATGIRAH